MIRQRIDVSTTTSAPASAVYALICDGASWPTWSPIGSFELEKPGDDGDGLGAIRVFRTGRITSREQIIELVPDRRLSYIVLSGLAIRDYRADIDLAADPRGTTIRWHSSFYPKVLGTGWLYRRNLGTFIEQCANGLAAHAEARPRAGNE